MKPLLIALLLWAVAARGQAGAPVDGAPQGAVIKVWGVDAEVARFAVGEKIFSGRRGFEMVECPESLKGLAFVRDHIEDDIFECVEDGLVTVLTPAPDKHGSFAARISRAEDLLRSGFVRLKTPPFELVRSVRVALYQKHLVKGERFRFPDSRWVVLTGFRRAELVSAPHQEIQALALQPPEVNCAPDARYADENRAMNMFLGADRTPGGRIWAAWVSGADGEKGYIVAASSNDEGETWTPPRLVLDPADHPAGMRRRALVGNFWTDPKGRLWLFFDQSMYYFDGRAGTWFIRCENPDAAAPVWTKPERIWHGALLQKPLVLSSGAWLLPISLWNFPGAGRFEELDPDRKAWLFASTDEGRSWHKQGGVRFPNFNYDEHMVVELRDGRLWLTARTRKGIYECFSTDQGKTWNKPKPAAIVNDSTRHFIRRLQSGRLLLVKNGPPTKDVGRRQLMAFLSDDEGQTWSGGLELEARDRSCSYPDGFQGGDGRIFIGYDHERTGAKEILMARFTEADVLARRLVSPGSRLRLLVNKAKGTSE